MTLVIERLRNRFRTSTPLDPARVGAWSEAFGRIDGDALTAGLTGPDEWLLIRRLPLAMRWRADASEAEVGSQWHHALRQALEQALARPDGDEVVRYASRRDALADLLYRSALGDRARQWAWQRMGLVARADLAPAEVLGQGLALLAAEPGIVWPVLHRLIQAEADTAALTAVLRAVPPAGWRRLLLACPHSRAYVQALLQKPAESPDDEPLRALMAQAARELQAHPAALELIAWAAMRPWLAAQRRETLTLLTACLIGSSAGQASTVVNARLAVASDRLSAHKHPPGHDERAASVPQPVTDIARPATERAADLPPLPALPSPEEWLPTAWAGALFWLARLSPEILQEPADAPLHGLPLRLRAVAGALGVPADDAAMRAFCGGEVPSDEPGELLQQRALALAEGWSAWLDKEASDLPAPRLLTVCQRHGRLRFEPGWIELHLPMSGVDTAVRRLGLDLDPGWLPWLGCVLRICYDE